jgi:hypothetical protein
VPDLRKEINCSGDDLYSSELKLMQNVLGHEEF